MLSLGYVHGPASLVLHLSAPPCGEFEIKAYSREHFVQNHAYRQSVPLPFLCFIDGFGLYCNMYRSHMGVYTNLARMTVQE